VGQTAGPTVAGIVAAVTDRHSDGAIGSLATAVRHTRLAAPTARPTRPEAVATGRTPHDRSSTGEPPMRAACRSVSTHAASAR
jgi:hypothetical protein